MCRPINFQKKKQEEKPYIEIITSLFIGMVFQLPRVMVFEIEECCFHRNFNAILNQTEIDCVYKGKRIEELEKSNIWMTYRVIREFLNKIGPTIILVCLNVAILREFNVSIQRKKLLKANSRMPKFVKRHSRMELFRKSNKKSNLKTVP